MMQKSEIKELLSSCTFGPIIEEAKKDRKVIRMLISLVYDKEDILSWRAIEAIGLVSGEIARTNVDMIRNLGQRFLWMMRDESGNGPGSAPEILGEIVRNSPDAFADIGQVVTSFHEEKMLRRGVMRAIWRIVDKRPDLLCISHELAEEELCLKDDDAAVRAYALMITGTMGLKKYQPLAEELVSDMSMVTIYNEGEFMTTSVAEIARKVLSGLQAGKSGIS